MNIQKKNFILRYVPSMFRLQKGVREYLLETYSDLHYTAPNIYDQKVKASQGTVRGNRGLPGLLEYFSVNIYSSSLLNDERLIAAHISKMHDFTIDSSRTVFYGICGECAKKTPTAKEKSDI